MSLFHRKKEEKPCCSCQNAAAEDVKAVSEAVTDVKVLGAGCRSCHQMYENAKQAVQNAGLGVEVEYITDMERVMQYGVMTMPALVVNGRVFSAGRILRPAEIEKLIR